MAMNKLIVFGVCVFMLATITHQPCTASPNECEFLIASEERQDLIDQCIAETWGEVE